MTKDQVLEEFADYPGIIKLYNIWLQSRLPDMKFMHTVRAPEFDSAEEGSLDGFMYRIIPNGSGEAEVSVEFTDDGFISLAEDLDELSEYELLAVEAACEAEAELRQFAR